MVIVLVNNKKSFDINPQWLNVPRLTESAVNTYTEVAVPCPTVQSLNNGKALVMEILKIYWYPSKEDWVNITDITYTAALKKTSSVGMPEPGSSNIVDMIQKFSRIIDTAATDATFPVQSIANPIIHDLTDGAGNGMLYGKTSMVLCILQAAAAVAGSIAVKILYRLKEVSSSELVGIIQE